MCCLFCHRSRKEIDIKFSLCWFVIGSLCAVSRHVCCAWVCDVCHACVCDICVMCVSLVSRDGFHVCVCDMHVVCVCDMCVMFSQVKSYIASIRTGQVPGIISGLYQC